MTLKERQDALEKEMLDLGRKKIEQDIAEGRSPLTLAIFKAIASELVPSFQALIDHGYETSRRNAAEKLGAETLANSIGVGIFRTIALAREGKPIAESTVADRVGEELQEEGRRAGVTIERTAGLELATAGLGKLLKGELAKFVTVIDRTAQRKTVQLQPSDELRELLKQEPELFLTPRFLPCVLPPEPWARTWTVNQGPRITGGYHTEDMKRRYRFVRGQATRGWASEHLRLLARGKAGLPIVFAAVNAVQETAWTINKRVYELLRPVTPQDVTNTTHRALEIAARFLDGTAIYFPHTLQVTGRLQPGPVDLNPNGDDTVKAVLTFAHGKALKTQDAVDALAVHGANMFGFKGTLAARIAWVNAHEAQILSANVDGAKKPWQFLAFCFEWQGYKREGLTFRSSLPVIADGTCNGLQHLSAMLRDEEGGRETNLTPSAVPHDIYQVVAEKAGLTRDAVKPAVMTYTYGQGSKSRREAFEDAGFSAEDAARIEPLVKSAIEQTVVKAPAVMKWLRKIAKTSASLDRPIWWVTPAGLPVWCIKPEEESVRIDVELDGTRKALTFKLPTADDDGVAIPDADDMVTAITALFVHSMDGAHLHRTMQQAAQSGIESLTTIHDGFGTVAADAPKLWALLREQFTAMYEDHDVLTELRTRLNAAEPDLEIPEAPEKGTLDIHGVLKSEYFFS